MTTETVTAWLTSAEFPLLKRFALNDEELRALSRQGFVHSERRGTKTIFRLRFRVDGRQRVRYVARHDAAAIEAELALLQFQVRAHRRLTRLAALARQLLRDRSRHDA